MSGVVVDFPGCGVVNSTKDQNSQTITVTTDQCAPPAPEPQVPTWTFFLVAVLVFVFIVATAIVRFRRHERLQAEHMADVSVETVKAAAKHTSCPTCGTVYVPESKR